MLRHGRRQMDHALENNVVDTVDPGLLSFSTGWQRLPARSYLKQHLKR